MALYVLYGFVPLCVSCSPKSYCFLQIPVTNNPTTARHFRSMNEKFFKRFVSIESLRVDVIYLIDVGEKGCIFKWKAMGYPESFILLKAKPKVGATGQIDSRLEQVVDDNVEKRKLKLVMEHYFRTMYRVLDKLLQTWGFPDLKDVELTYCSTRGRLLVGNKTDLDRRRMSIPMTMASTVSKLWTVPALKLPSGLVVEEPLLAIIKGSINIDDVSLAQHAFQEEEEKAFLEVAMELLKLKPHYDGCFGSSLFS